MRLTRGTLCALGVPIMLALTCRLANAALFSDNVVVTGTHNDSSHIQGMTFDNNLNPTNYADFGQNTTGTGDWLTVAGAVGAGSLTMEHGVFRHAGNLPGAFAANYNGGSSQVEDTSVSISGLTAEITADTAYYAGLSATGTGSYVNNAYAITTSAPGVKVFNVPASLLTNQNENINLSLATGSDAVIVVNDVSFTLGSSMHINLIGATTPAQILWVFPNATTISFNSLWQGSILAPNATLADNSTDLNGGVYVNNFNQTGEVHLGMYNGSPPPAPEPASLAVLSLGTVALLKRQSRSR